MRSHVPLLVGLTGPSGSGKTFTALRIATGIQTVTGGDIYFIDTESRRALHYADRFKFKHVPFDAPFGSLDYLEALQFCVGRGAGVVIVDSMSHEHEGPGGMVDLHDAILDRMAGDDWKKRDKMTMLAWSEPKQKRRRLINGILQLNANFVFCFRAKNTSKPVKGANGKTEVEQMGFMPIAGEEFVYEQTLNALLYPGANGVPTWEPEGVGEKTMVKLPRQFRALARRPGPLDEEVGMKMAQWAAGDDAAVDEGGDEGRAVSDMGEAHNDSEEGDTSPSAMKARELIAKAEAVRSDFDLEALEKEAAPHLEFMADDWAAKVAAAIEAARPVSADQGE
ncbi:hypothetical protein L286_23605 [Sphingobium sp. HDIP04]|nr:hypothetical protein L286_23605 [Sphingobium sp. HDIP04]